VPAFHSPRLAAVRMPRQPPQSRAICSNAETAKHVQSAHIAIDTIDRRQKWTRHVCWRDFRHPGTAGEFIVKDASGRALAYFYWWGDGTALLTRDEARCLAEKFARMPSFMVRRSDARPPMNKGWALAASGRPERGSKEMFALPILLSKCRLQYAFSGRPQLEDPCRAHAPIRVRGPAEDALDNRRGLSSMSDRRTCNNTR
jgi:hypothetical protein